MTSCVHVNKKGKDILIFGEGPMQGLDDTTLTPEAKYPIDFTQSGCKQQFFLLMPQKYINSKQETQK